MLFPSSLQAPKQIASPHGESNQAQEIMFLDTFKHRLSLQEKPKLLKTAP